MKFFNMFGLKCNSIRHKKLSEMQNKIFFSKNAESLSNIEQFIPGYSSCPAGGAPGGLAAWLIFQIVSSPEGKIIHSNFKET